MDACVKVDYVCLVFMTCVVIGMGGLISIDTCCNLIFTVKYRETTTLVNDMIVSYIVQYI